MPTFAGRVQVEPEKYPSKNEKKETTSTTAPYAEKLATLDTKKQAIFSRIETQLKQFMEREITKEVTIKRLETEQQAIRIESKIEDGGMDYVGNINSIDS